MPAFSLICNNCGWKRRVIRPQGWMTSIEQPRCRQCMTRMERDPQGANSGPIVKETIDNGAMVKPLERFADAERLHKERIQIEDAVAKGQDPGKPIV